MQPIISKLSPQTEKQLGTLCVLPIFYFKYPRPHPTPPQKSEVQKNIQKFGITVFMRR